MMNFSIKDGDLKFLMRKNQGKFTGQFKNILCIIS